MTRKTMCMLGGALVIAAAMAVGVGAAAQAMPPDGTGASDPPEHEVPITGEALARASAAALAHTGGGMVTETEVGDEEGYYEVEVTRPDGSQVDVHLDDRFTVLGTVADSEDGPR